MSTGPLEASPEGYALAYREARSGLEEQERAVVELRSRSGALIAAAAITTSFFGGEALTRHDISPAAWVAIGCFALLGFTVLAVLWPRHDWEFSIEPDKFIAIYLEPADEKPLAPHLIERDLALHMGRSAAKNRNQLRTLMSVFRVGAVLLVGEVLAWIIALLSQR